MPTPADLNPHQRELLAAYRARDLSVKEILITFGATRSELDTVLSRAREPFRRPASATPARNLRRRAPFDVLAPTTVEAGLLMERRLARLLSERIADLEDRCAPGRSADPEGVAKALDLSVRTLATLRRAAAGQDPYGPDPDAPDTAGRPATRGHHREDTDAASRQRGRSLVQLRDELYGHLQRIQDEEDAAGAGPARDDGERDGGDAPPLAPLLP